MKVVPVKMGKRENEESLLRRRRMVEEIGAITIVSARIREGTFCLFFFLFLLFISLLFIF